MIILPSHDGYAPINYEESLLPPAVCPLLASDVTVSETTLAEAPDILTLSRRYISRRKKQKEINLSYE